MSTAVMPTPFSDGYRLINGTTLNRQLADDIVSSQDGITAFAGGGVTNAVQLTAGISRVTTVTNANDSVKLRKAVAGSSVVVDNDGANNLSIYPSGTDQIEDSTSAVTIVPGEDATFVCPAAGKWYQLGQTGGSFTASTLVLNGSTSGSTTIQAAAIASGTVTVPAVTGTLAVNNPAPVAAGATLAVTAAMSNAPILLNIAAGSTATLPAATGSGNKYRFIVTTTASSNAHKILAASVSDFLNGVAVGHVAAGTTLSFSAAAATAHSIQMPFAGTQPSGGFIGDYFDFIDVAANLWAVSGMYQSGTTSTTPFSASTT